MGLTLKGEPRQQRTSEFSVRLTMIFLLLAWACSLSIAEVLDRDKLQDVMAKVHGNSDFTVHYDDVEEAREELQCYGHFTRDIDPVCGSNGKKYTNLSMFNYRKCMMKVQEDTEIQLMDMGFCKDAEMEDMEHEHLA